MDNGSNVDAKCTGGERASCVRDHTTVCSVRGLSWLKLHITPLKTRLWILMRSSNAHGPRARVILNHLEGEQEFLVCNTVTTELKVLVQSC